MFKVGELVHFTNDKGDRHKSVARVVGRDVTANTYTLEYTSRKVVRQVTLNHIRVISRRPPGIHY